MQGPLFTVLSPAQRASHSFPYVVFVVVAQTGIYSIVHRHGDGAFDPGSGGSGVSTLPHSPKLKVAPSHPAIHAFAYVVFDWMSHTGFQLRGHAHPDCGGGEDGDDGGDKGLHSPSKKGSSPAHLAMHSFPCVTPVTTEHTGRYSLVHLHGASGFGDDVGDGGIGLHSPSKKGSSPAHLAMHSFPCVTPVTTEHTGRYSLVHMHGLPGSGDDVGGGEMSLQWPGTKVMPSQLAMQAFVYVTRDEVSHTGFHSRVH